MKRFIAILLLIVFAFSFYIDVLAVGEPAPTIPDGNIFLCNLFSDSFQGWINSADPDSLGYIGGPFRTGEFSYTTMSTATGNVGTAHSKTGSQLSYSIKIFETTSSSYSTYGNGYLRLSPTFDVSYFSSEPYLLSTWFKSGYQIQLPKSTTWLDCFQVPESFDNVNLCLNLVFSLSYSTSQFDNVGDVPANMLLHTPDGSIYYAGAYLKTSSTVQTAVFQKVAEDNLSGYALGFTFTNANGTLRFSGSSSSANIGFVIGSNSFWSIDLNSPPSGGGSGEMDTAAVVDAIAQMEESLGGKLDDVSSKLEGIQNALNDYGGSIDTVPDFAGSLSTMSPEMEDSINSGIDNFLNGLDQSLTNTENALAATSSIILFLYTGNNGKLPWLAIMAWGLTVSTFFVFIVIMILRFDPR